MDLATSIVQFVASVLMLATALVELVRTCLRGDSRKKRKR